MSAKKISGIGAGVGLAATAALAATTLLVVGGQSHSSESNSKPSQTTTTQSDATGANTTTVSRDWAAVSQAARGSVVAIKVRGDGRSGQGSGVVYGTDGHIVTNHHVVDAAREGGKIQVAAHDGRLFTKVTIVGTDPHSDLAVLKVADKGFDLKPMPIGDSEAVKPGQAVMAIGNPMGLSDTVTTGIVSAVNRPVMTTQRGASTDFGEAETIRQVTNAIQTDAAINPGNSGGALVDAGGKLIGINSSIVSMPGARGGSAGSIGLGFAIPTKSVQRVADSLIEKGVVAKAFLGVGLESGTVKTDDSQRMAAVLSQISPDTAAEKAGLKVGDGVIAIDGEVVRDARGLMAQVRERSPGQEITLKIVRDGKEQEMKITLGSKSQQST